MQKLFLYVPVQSGLVRAPYGHLETQDLPVLWLHPSGGSWSFLYLQSVNGEREHGKLHIGGFYKPIQCRSTNIPWS